MSITITYVCNKGIPGYICNQGSENFTNRNSLISDFNFGNIAAIEKIEISDMYDLKYLYEQFTNIPKVNSKSKVTFYGDMAKFIIANI